MFSIYYTHENLYMTDFTDSVLRRYIEKTGLMFEDFGFPRIMGQVGAYVYLVKGPLSLEQIAGALRISKGSASTNCRALERLRYIRAVRSPGDRKGYYEFAGSLWPALQESAENFNRGHVEDFRQLNDECLPLVDGVRGASGSDQEGSVHLAKQLKELKTLFKFIDLIVALVSVIRSKPGRMVNSFFKVVTGTRKAQVSS